MLIKKRNGGIYSFGRDARLRPIVIVKLSVFVNAKAALVEQSLLKVQNEIQQSLLVRGRVETYVVIADFSGTSYSSYKKVEN